MWPTLVFGLLLIVISAALIISHLVSRRHYSATNLDAEEQAYRRRQFRRRMQASTLIGIVGLASIGGLWVDGPPAEALYWCGVLLVVVWVLFLAGADAASTQSFFRGVQKRRIDEHAELQKEIERYRHQGNGR